MPLMACVVLLTVFYSSILTVPAASGEDIISLLHGTTELRIPLFKQGDVILFGPLLMLRRFLPPLAAFLLQRFVMAGISSVCIIFTAATVFSSPFITVGKVSTAIFTFMMIVNPPTFVSFTSISPDFIPLAAVCLITAAWASRNTTLLTLFTLIGGLYGSPAILVTGAALILSDHRHHPLRRMTLPAVVVLSAFAATTAMFHFRGLLALTPPPFRFPTRTDVINNPLPILALVVALPAVLHVSCHGRLGLLLSIVLFMAADYHYGAIAPLAALYTVLAGHSVLSVVDRYLSGLEAMMYHQRRRHRRRSGFAVSETRYLIYITITALLVYLVITTYQAWLSTPEYAQALFAARHGELIEGTMGIIVGV
ncbi:hypothetical protein J8273_7106 [Carpediemonas membranifera]|uniref:Uncharacterized protein n=1 Tax=Carpediemonas membranifera TaxID=201153 RepID=A0A8J6E1N2_9EUKA|nr:hypothetical protein J8273_7106 [Carpediemonas membranifera]|eukprot:KAG9390847.1 hypothetical protein J8273_7106 [Carpediemonas membranifera]